MKKPLLTNRQIQEKYLGRKVRVYFNLHSKKWSVQDYKTRIVLCHADVVTVKDATGFVSEAGRQRVIRESRKNVHAFIVGTISVLGNGHECMDSREITYNPYRYDSFVHKFDESKFEGADYVDMAGRDVVAYNVINA